MLGKDFTIPGVTRHVFESFSQRQSFSRSAGLSANSHHLQPRKAVFDQPFAPFHFDDYALYQDLRAFRPLIASYCSGRGTPWKNGAVFYCCACLPAATNPRSAGRCQSGWRRRCISIFGISTEPKIFCRILMRFAFPLISPDK